MAISLSIAGSDPSAGAGIQADLKTFHAHRVHGCAVISLLTVQNTKGVRRVVPVEARLFEEQLACLLEDLEPHAVKTGALGTAAHVAIVAEQLATLRAPLVVDPVMVSKTGAVLLDDAARRVLLSHFLPRAALITPNLDEARLLTGRALDSAAAIGDAACALIDAGAKAVLIKGGHRSGAPIDVLHDGRALYELRAERIETVHTHGVGCTLSAAITARLALGESLLAACEGAKEWLTRAIASAPGLGHGQGPVNHLEPLLPPS